MDDLRQLHNKVNAYLADEISAEDLEDWASDLAMASQSIDVRQQAGHVVNLLQLANDGHRSESDIRAELRHSSLLNVSPTASTV